MRTGWYIILIASCSFVLQVNILTAQNASWLWATNTGGGTVEDIATDFNGNVFITGEFNATSITFGNIRLINSGGGNYDLFIAKYDSSGHVLWAKNATSTGIEYCYCVAADAFGNVYIAGKFNSASLVFGSTILSTSGGMDIFLAKYDPAGNVLWAKKAGGNDTDVPHGIAIDASRNIVIAGEFYSSGIKFGNTTLTNTGTFSDIFLAKYDPSGNAIWAKSATGTNADYGTGVSVDASGNVYMVGYYFSSPITIGNITLNNSPGIFTAKYDASGNVLWARTSVGTTINTPTAIASDAAGNAYICGYFLSNISFGNITLINSGAYFDLFLAKYDAAGNILWAKNPSGSTSETAEDVATDSEGNVSIVGIFLSDSLKFDSITLINSSIDDNDDIFIAKYDAAGNILSAINPKGSGGELGSDIAIDARGNEFISGSIYSDAIFGDITLVKGPGLYDLFLAKYGAAGCDKLFYADSDGDGYGNPNVSKQSCTPPLGYVADNTDCNDAVASIHPGAADLCNGIDDNCNGVIDENAFNASINPSGTITICQGTYIQLSAIPLNASSYQWTLNGSKINGATKETFAARKKGSYQVTITNSFGCSSTSHSTKVKVQICRDELTENKTPLLTVYPNPTNGRFTVDLNMESETGEQVSLQVINPAGQIIYNETASLSNGELKKEIFLNHAGGSGIYLVIVVVNHKEYQSRLEIQK